MATMQARWNRHRHPHHPDAARAHVHPACRHPHRTGSGGVRAPPHAARSVLKRHVEPGSRLASESGTKGGTGRWKEPHPHATSCRCLPPGMASCRRPCLRFPCRMRHVRCPRFQGRLRPQDRRAAGGPGLGRRRGVRADRFRLALALFRARRHPAAALQGQRWRAGIVAALRRVLRRRRPRRRLARGRMRGPGDRILVRRKYPGYRSPIEFQKASRGG